MTRADVAKHTLALVVVLLTGGCRTDQGGSTPPPTERASTPAPTVMEHACAPSVPAGARCGTVQVFENRDTRQGRTIDLAYVVLPATGAAQPDPVFVLAGGPGQAATNLLVLASATLASVNETRDLVFVDQRGTGASNGLRCDSEELDAILRGPWDETNHARLVECGRSLPADLAWYATPPAMDDLDEVRAALGYDEINLWGGSYGTRAALVYLRQHGDHVRSVALWGVAPPGQPFMRTFAPQGQAALDAVLADCAADARCKAVLPDGVATIERIMARLLEVPARVAVTDPRDGSQATVELTPELFASSLRLSLYDTEWAASLPVMLSAADRGDYEPFMSMVTPISVAIREQIHLGMFMTVACAEDVPLLTAQDFAAADRTFMGDEFLRSLQSTCAKWPKAPLPAGYLEPVRSDVPVLLMAGTVDPVTPPATAELAAATLSRSRVVPFPGTGHGTGSASACEEQLVRRFMDDPNPATLDVSCTKALERPPFALGRSN
jgi:pimeloyl-ACP methyl ester carboxylesterase